MAWGTTFRTAGSWVAGGVGAAGFGAAAGAWATISGLGAGLTMVGLATWAGAGAAGFWGLLAGLTAGFGLAAPAGLAGVAAAAGAAFLRERMALAGSLAGGVGRTGWLAGAPPPLAGVLIRLRMRSASPSLMELLWLLTAMDSFSAASSTSLFSRPRSRDSS